MNDAGSGRSIPFGELLREYRIEARLTQEALAARSGLSIDAIGMLERGVRRAPRPSTVMLLVEALRLSPTRRDALVASARHRPGAPLASRLPEPGAGIPPDPSPFFVGRESELAELGRQLAHGARVAVHGLGGVGKTQLVVQYLWHRRADYGDGLFWLRADHESTLVGDLASLAWRLGLPEREVPEQERQIEAVLRWLRGHPRWLMVLDNLEPEAVAGVQRWLPPGLLGRLLITSRAPIWPASLGLEPLSLEDARRFLLLRTGQADTEAAGVVAETLGGLPLALEQAAAFLEVSGRDLTSYAELLRNRLVEVMEEGKPHDYPRPLATTWRISVARLEAERPAAAALLRLCAFLAPDDIPVGLLGAAAGELPEALRETLVDNLEFDRTIAALRRYSFVERRGDGLRVHRLVQALVRGSLGADERQAWLGAAIRLVYAGFPTNPPDQPDQWPLCLRMLAHARTVDRLAADPIVEPLVLSRLLNRVGVYLWARGEFATARHSHERALAIQEREMGPLDPGTAENLNDLAITLFSQGEYVCARHLMERALAIRERVLGPDHPSTAESLSTLAWLLRSQRELAAARPLFERALAICERAFGPEHPYPAKILHNLGVLQVDQGDVAAARPFFERALAVRERVLGDDHLRTAFSRKELAGVLRAQGELAAARALSERVQATFERLLGPEHRWTADNHRLLEELASETERPGGETPRQD